MKAVPETFPVRMVGLHNIIVDPELQSRVQTNPEYEREFAEAMQRGDVFPPVVLFDDGRRLWLAEGFHRVGAAKSLGPLGVREIRAEVRPGTKRDATIFSAGANLKFSIPRSRDDVRKAIEMVLRDPEWWESSDASIARHCGASKSTVRFVRVDFARTNGLFLPDTVKCSNGNTQKYEIAKSRSPALLAYSQGPRGRAAFATHVDGRLVSLGTDRESAKAAISELHAQQETRRRGLTPGNLLSFLVRRGFSFESCVGAGGARNGISGLVGHDCVCVSSYLDDARSVPLAVGAVFLLRQHVGQPSARMIVVCYRESGLARQIDLATRAGVEFLSPEELADSLGGASPGEEHG